MFYHKKRLVAWCGAVLALWLGLAGCSSTATPSTPGQLAPIAVQGTRLMAGGRPFDVRGVNYIHPSNADMSKCSALQFGADAQCPWDLAPISSDFDMLQAHGVNTVRVFLNYYVFGGARAADANYSMEQPLAHLDSFISEANRHNIYVLPVLLAKYPQDRFRTEDYTATLELHVRPLVAHLANRPGLLAWDLFNEPDLGGPVDERCWDWDNADFPLCLPLANERLRFIDMLHREVKQLDPSRLTTVSLGFAKNYFEPANADMRMADVVDFYAFHYYDNDPYESGRYAQHWYYGQGFPADERRAIAELTALQPSKPVLITELGFPSGAGTKRTDDELHRDLATALQVARDEKTSGMIVWPFQPKLDTLIGDLFTKN